LGLSNKLVSITANNASSNSTLAAHVEPELGGIFEANIQLLGCMAHVINLAAQDGIKVFGSSSGTEKDSEEEVTLRQMDIGNLVDQPDGFGLDLSTIVSCVHGLVTYICGLPQRCKGFQTVANFVNNQSNSSESQSNAKMLILNVRTCWNSTFRML
jgi:hypothetical protein